MDRAAKIVFCFSCREQITLLVAGPSCNTSIYNASCAFWYQIWWLAGGGPWSEQLSVSVVFCHEYYYYLILARPHCYWFGFNTIAGFLWGERERERERERDFIPPTDVVSVFQQTKSYPTILYRATSHTATSTAREGTTNISGVIESPPNTRTIQVRVHVLVLIFE